MKNGSIICWCKRIGTFVVLISILSGCHSSSFWFNKRISHSRERVEDSVSNSVNRPVTAKPAEAIVSKKDILVNSDSVAVIPALTIPESDIQKTFALIHTTHVLKKPVVSNKNRIEKRAVKQKNNRKPNSAGDILMSIFFLLLLLVILVLAGIGMYWIGIWSFALAFSLAYCIAVFILAIMAATLVMGALLALWFMCLYSYAHSQSHISPYYPEKR